MSISSSGMILYSLSCVQYTEQETSPKEHNLHKKIILDGNWTFGDWKSKRQLQKINTTFTPDEKLAELETGDLVFEHIWWSVQFLQVQRQENFQVGLFDYQISDISLRDHFSVQVETPIEKSPITGNSLRAFDNENINAQWLSPPYVLTHPKKHITDTSFRYTNGGVNASISFNTEISATLDLKILNHQDEVVSTYAGEVSNVDMVEINNLSFPSTYLWSFEEPNQVEIQVVLRDVLNNEVLDILRYQTGFREFTFENQTFYINQIPHPHFRAARLEIEEDWTKRLQEILQSGVQAIEIHGEIIPDGLLEWADRVGMGVIIVPRCIGRTMNGTLENLKEIANQDVRLLKKIKKHPSVLFVVSEGEDVEANLISSTFEDYGYLVGGRHRDFPTGRLRIDVKNPSKSVCLPHRDCNMWITEITLVNHTPKTNWKKVAQYQEQYTSKSIGYVLPVERRFPIEWANAFKRMSDLTKEAPQEELYEGKPNSFMWLNANEGVLFDETGLYSRYR